MPYALQQLRALIVAHPDRAANLERHVQALEGAIATDPQLCLYRVRTLFEAVHLTIAPQFGIDLSDTEHFPARNSRLIKAMDFTISGHPDAEKIGATIAKLLGSINGATSALAELSNYPNLRHGGSLDWGTLERQHAVMLGGLCDTLVGFLFEIAWRRALAEPSASDPERYEDFSAFNASLDNEYGDVKIAGSAFAPSRILYMLDPTQYDTARGEWEMEQADASADEGIVV